MATTSNLALPPLPASLKSIGHFIKTAAEHETRDPVVTYWCRLCALQTGLKLDKSSKEATAVLIPLMDWLEKEKKVLASNEAVSSEIVASAHLENSAMRLFGWADKEDRAARFNKNVVKAFYTSGVIFDVLPLFGELTPENAHARKYAKWKAAYIHNCLKNGETPIPGPATSGEDGEEDGAAAAVGGGGAAGYEAGGWQMPQVPPAAVAPAAAPAVAPTSYVPTPTPRSTAALPPQHYPTPAAAAAAAVPPVEEAASSSSSGLTSVQITKAKKYCKYAASSLDYDDKATAIDNLQKALRLLETGQD